MSVSSGGRGSSRENITQSSGLEMSSDKTEQIPSNANKEAGRPHKDSSASNQSEECCLERKEETLAETLCVRQVDSASEHGSPMNKAARPLKDNGALYHEEEKNFLDGKAEARPERTQPDNCPQSQAENEDKKLYHVQPLKDLVRIYLMSRGVPKDGDFQEAAILFQDGKQRGSCVTYGDNNWSRSSEDFKTSQEAKGLTKLTKHCHIYTNNSEIQTKSIAFETKLKIANGIVPAENEMNKKKPVYKLSSEPDTERKQGFQAKLRFAQETSQMQTRAVNGNEKSPLKQISQESDAERRKSFKARLKFAQETSKIIDNDSKVEQPKGNKGEMEKKLAPVKFLKATSVNSQESGTDTDVNNEQTSVKGNNSEPDTHALLSFKDKLKFAEESSQGLIASTTSNNTEEHQIMPSKILAKQRHKAYFQECLRIANRKCPAWNDETEYRREIINQVDFTIDRKCTFQENLKQAKENEFYPKENIQKKTSSSEYSSNDTLSNFQTKDTAEPNKAEKKSSQSAQFKEIIPEHMPSFQDKLNFTQATSQGHTLTKGNTDGDGKQTLSKSPEAKLGHKAYFRECLRIAQGQKEAWNTKLTTPSQERYEDISLVNKPIRKLAFLRQFRGNETIEQEENEAIPKTALSVLNDAEINCQNIDIEVERDQSEGDLSSSESLKISQPSPPDMIDVPITSDQTAFEEEHIASNPDIVNVQAEQNIMKYSQESSPGQTFTNTFQNIDENKTISGDKETISNRDTAEVTKVCNTLGDGELPFGQQSPLSSATNARDKKEDASVSSIDDQKSPALETDISAETFKSKLKFAWASSEEHTTRASTKAAEEREMRTESLVSVQNEDFLKQCVKIPQGKTPAWNKDSISQNTSNLTDTKEHKKVSFKEIIAWAKEKERCQKKDNIPRKTALPELNKAIEDSSKRNLKIEKGESREPGHELSQSDKRKVHSPVRRTVHTVRTTESKDTKQTSISDETIPRLNVGDSTDAGYIQSEQMKTEEKLQSAVAACVQETILTNIKSEDGMPDKASQNIATCQAPKEKANEGTDPEALYVTPQIGQYEDMVNKSTSKVKYLEGKETCTKEMCTSKDIPLKEKQGIASKGLLKTGEKDVPNPIINQYSKDKQSIQNDSGTETKPSKKEAGKLGLFKTSYAINKKLDDTETRKPLVIEEIGLQGGTQVCNTDTMKTQPDEEILKVKQSIDNKEVHKIDPDEQCTQTHKKTQNVGSGKSDGPEEQQESKSDKETAKSYSVLAETMLEKDSALTQTMSYLTIFDVKEAKRIQIDTGPDFEERIAQGQREAWDTEQSTLPQERYKDISLGNRPIRKLAFLEYFRSNKIIEHQENKNTPNTALSESKISKDKDSALDREESEEILNSAECMHILQPNSESDIINAKVKYTEVDETEQKTSQSDAKQADMKTAHRSSSAVEPDAMSDKSETRKSSKIDPADGQVTQAYTITAGTIASQSARGERLPQTANIPVQSKHVFSDPAKIGTLKDKPPDSSRSVQHRPETKAENKPGKEEKSDQSTGKEGLSTLGTSTSKEGISKFDLGTCRGSIQSDQGISKVGLNLSGPSKSDQVIYNDKTGKFVQDTGKETVHKSVSSNAGLGSEMLGISEHGVKGNTNLFKKEAFNIHRLRKLLASRSFQKAIIKLKGEETGMRIYNLLGKLEVGQLDQEKSTCVNTVISLDQSKPDNSHANIEMDKSSSFQSSSFQTCIQMGERSNANLLVEQNNQSKNESKDLRIPRHKYLNNVAEINRIETKQAGTVLPKPSDDVKLWLSARSIMKGLLFLFLLLLLVYLFFLQGGMQQVQKFVTMATNMSEEPVSEPEPEINLFWKTMDILLPSSQN